jgi:hypothetical protein
MSEAVATELRGLYNADVAAGIYGQHGLSCFSPVINIMRHPLWGRNQVRNHSQCLKMLSLLNLPTYFIARTGVEIRGRPVVKNHNFLGKDDPVLADFSPSDDLIFALVIVLCEKGRQSFGRDYHVIQIW